MAGPLPTPPRVNLARLPTPLEPMPNLSRELGGPRIWVKRDDLTEGPAGGNKLRKLEYSIGQALTEGADVLITAGAKQSNHCRQTAFAAARLGLGCHLVLAGRPPRSAPDGNLLLDELLGAEATFVTGQEFEDLPTIFATLCDRYRGEGATPFCIPVGASDEIGLWGYVNAAIELADDCRRLGIDPTHIVTAVGSGATHGGLMVGARLAGLRADVLGIAVSRDAAHFRTEIPRIVRRWTTRYGVDLGATAPAPLIVDSYIPPGYGRAEARVYETIRRVAGLEGLIFDPVYTGKAMDGLLQEIQAGRLGPTGDVIFVHTGGIYGLFPHREQLSRPPDR